MAIAVALAKTDLANSFTYVKTARNKLVIGLICCIFAANSYLLVPLDNGTRTLVENTFAPATSLLAVIASVVVVARQKLDGLFGRAYFFLAVGLIFWCTAEVIWSYNILIIGEESPFPSIADAFWLAAYAPFGYHLASMYKFYRPRTSRITAIAVSLSVSAFTALYAINILSTSDLSGPDATTSIAISLAYPLLDALIIVPAILIVMNNSGRGMLTAIPWIFISWILTAIADSLFGYTAVASLIGEVTIWNLFYNAAYLCMAAGLIWHNKFFVIDDKKGAKLWAESNR